MRRNLEFEALCQEDALAVTRNVITSSRGRAYRSVIGTYIVASICDKTSTQLGPGHIVFDKIGELSGL